MGRHFRPQRVYQTASSFLATNLIPGKAGEAAPAWLKAVESIPPAELLTRPYPIQHTAPNPRAKKPHNIFRPTRITYPEDELRRDFYRDHPWELARPKMVLELDGKDARYRDWSKGLRQPGMPLSGESVVQRQLWLMENTPGMSKQMAYDIARREFYKLRQQEEMERRIAQEEARMVGAYFGKSQIQIGMELEDQTFEAWKAWAGQEIARIEAQRSAAYTSIGDMPDEVVAEDGEEAEAVGAGAMP
ncbi:mitochondrial ribosomal protein S25 [Diplogelasinospora grovesii]|uniref:37S ribosomal protein S25, mitochondrial n=1 Tax=Diplogelasinospora grovesii TaxID=303347 RepID=A0AAN6S6F0_9PEZI|nr:mitochondrial ribosomal protein S25 [Diplogelasinospora grovesii]